MSTSVKLQTVQCTVNSTQNALLNYRQCSVLLTRVLHWIADIALCSVLLTRDVGMTQSVVFCITIDDLSLEEISH